MDCPNSGGGEKSLPGMGMGLPKWMRRTTERYDYTDICASPPSNEDGFFHMNRSRARQQAQATTTSGGTGSNATVEVYQNSRRRNSGAKTSPDLTSAILEIERQGAGGEGPSKTTNFILSKRDCSTIPETSTFFKTASTTASLISLAVSSQAGLVSSPAPKPEGTVAVLQNPRPAVGCGAEPPAPRPKLGDLDSALSPADIPSMVVTKPNREIGSVNYKQFVDNMKDVIPRSPDATPNATPTVTPACSPQVARRAGNPFFTGSTPAAANNSGSWLFRSSSNVSNTDQNQKKDQSGYMYEARVDVSRPLSAGAGPGVPPPSDMSKMRQKVRYVPRPSEMRELNFWSPTSM